MTPPAPSRAVRGSGRLTPAGAERRGRRGVESGSVILLVLMTLLLTALALTKYLERTAIDLLADSRDASAGRLRVEAYSALDTVCAVLQEFRTVNGALHSPAEGWGDPLGFAGYVPPSGVAVTVTLEDESGKISLPHADFQTLRDLFILLGQKQADAERLADALMVWMQQGYEPVDAFSSRASDYERETIPFDPPGRSLHSFSELASIKQVRDAFFDAQGQPNALWRQFVDSVSLYDFSQPNINAARDTTLAALGNYDASNIKLIDEYLGGLGSYTRQGPAYFRNPQDVATLVGQTAVSSKFTTQVSCLRVNVTVREGQTAFKLSTVIAPQGGAKLPPADPPAAGNATTATETNASATDQANPAAATNNSPAAPTTSATAATPGTAGAASSASLNYPFALLEIRENDQITKATPPSQSALE